MPWMKMDESFLVHVPRCGGTSCTKHHRVAAKTRIGMNPWHKFGMHYFFYRYALYEHANFPIFTWENLFAMTQITVAIFIYFFVNPIPAAVYVMWCSASITFILSTFVWTAPVVMRNNYLRPFLMFFQSRVMCGFGGETKHVTGVTKEGFLLHLTAARCVKYGFVPLDTMRRCGFSVVRNPYSRAVSMFEYNKRPFETFDHFVRDIYKDYCNIYLRRATTECRYIYCHILPQFEYTHCDKEQIVSCVIKQEHLKKLIASDWEGSGVPQHIKDALSGIPHTNKRSRRVPWQQYFSQESMDLVHEMYKEDFEVFGYNPVLPNRPDLVLSEPTGVPATAGHDGNLGQSVRDFRAELRTGRSDQYEMVREPDLEQQRATPRVTVEAGGDDDDDDDLGEHLQIMDTSRGDENGSNANDNGSGSGSGSGNASGSGSGNASGSGSGSGLESASGLDASPAVGGEPSPTSLPPSDPAPDVSSSSFAHSGEVDVETGAAAKAAATVKPKPMVEATTPPDAGQATTEGESDSDHFDETARRREASAFVLAQPTQPVP